MNIPQKARIISLYASILIFFIPSNSFSQEDRIFKKIWFETVFKSSSTESLLKGVKSIEAKKCSLGIKNVYPYSQALIISAKEDIKKGLYREARMKVEASSFLSPDYISSYILMAKLDLMGRGGGFFSGIENIWKAIRVSLRNFPILMKLIGNFLYYFSLIILFVYGLFIIGVAVRVIAPLNHDVGHLLPYYFSEKIKWIFTIFMLTIPLILGLGILWLYFLYTCVLWFYLRKNEKIFGFVFVVFMILAPIGISIYSLAVFSLKSPHFLHLIVANEGLSSGEDKEALLEWLRDAEEIPEIYFTLGLVEKREGQLDNAIKYYRKAIDKDPFWAEAYNNLGNALFIQGNIKEAVEIYKKAVALGPERMASHYNLSQLYASLYNFDEAGKEMNKSISIDSSRIFRIQDLSALYGERILLDETLDMERYWGVAQRQFPEKVIVREEVFKKLYGFVSFPSYPAYVFSILMIMILVEIFSQKFDFSTKCINCGGAVCFRCRKKDRDEKFCHECIRLITYGERIDPDMRVLKSLQIKRFHRRERYLTLFSSILIPGLGMIIKGKLGRGLSMIFLSFTIIMLIFLNAPLQLPWILPIQKSSIGAYILITLFLIVYISNLRFVLKRLILWV